MCVWLLVACFGAFPVPTYQNPYYYNYGRPAFIVTPTGIGPLPTGAPTTLFPGLPTLPTLGPTTATTARPPTLPPLTPVPTAFPIIDPRGPALRIGELQYPERDDDSVSFPRSKRDANGEAPTSEPMDPQASALGELQYPDIDPNDDTLASLRLKRDATTLPPGPPPPTTPAPATTTMSIKTRDVEELAVTRPPLVSQAPASAGAPKAGDGVIIFPRDKRSARRKRQTANCGCLVGTICPSTGTGGGSNNFGAGLIDFRIVAGGGGIPTSMPPQCPTGMIYCCSTTSPQLSCGSRIQTTVTYPTVVGQAKYGDYPWMVVILTNDNLYVSGGILIDTQHVMTTAHRIANYANGMGLKVRLGEWDASGAYEQFPFRDNTILRVFTHESFNPNTLQNDLSIIRMSSALPAGTPGIAPICLPTTGQIFDGQRCWVSGWGKDSFASTGQFQAVLKAVDVPVMPSATCESTFKTTRLGTTFTFDRASFICAGGELNKDACTGDGGSGLVCETSAGRWTLAGLVAWGLGCATQGVPAAYVNVVNFLPWINSKLTTP